MLIAIQVARILFESFTTVIVSAHIIQLAPIKKFASFIYLLIDWSFNFRDLKLHPSAWLSPVELPLRCFPCFHVI